MAPLLYLFRDLAYAARGLKRSPMFTAVAVLSIALGIGANTAIFTLVDQVLLRLLPVKQPAQLVLLTSRGSHYGNNRGGNALSYPMYADFRDHNDVFSGMFCRFGLPLNISFNGRTERVAGELISGTYFDVLGVGAALGRTLTPADDKIPGGHPVAVLSYEYWTTRFAADQSVVGRSISVNGYPLTIIGVSEKGFEGTDIGYVSQVRVPMMMKAQMTPLWNDLDNRRSRWVNAFGRLKPTVSMTQAKASLQPFFHNMLEMEVHEPAFRTASSYARAEFLRSTIDVLPASQSRSSLRQQLTQPLWVLMAIVALVLLIACANVASLLIARATTRQKEIAVRLALGASRARLVVQLLAESVLLSMLGAAAGVLIAIWTSAVLLTFLPADDAPHVLSAAPDARILAFSFALALVTAILCGLIPAFRATRPDLAPTLKDQAGAVAGGGGQVRFRKSLVIAQVTLSLLLLIGAGLFIRSLRNLRTLELGLRTDGLLAFSVDPTLNGYSIERTKTFFKQLNDRLQTLPGVQRASFTAIGVLEGDEWDSTVTVEGYSAKEGEEMNPYCNAVGPGYFATLGIPLVAGRDFGGRDELLAIGPTKGDVPPSFRVAIANERFVKQYFGNENPVGRHIGFGGDPGTKTPIEIIGVVKDAKYTGVRDEIPRQLFFPYLESDFVGEMTGYVRTLEDPSRMFPAVRRVIQQLDTGMPIFNLRTLESQADRSLLTERLVATLSAAFGGLATLLAIIGLYGVMAYTVARRTQEIGIRIALGALSGDVIWLVMREVLVLVGAGLCLGLAGAWGFSRLVQSQLYGVTPTDPVAIAAATLALAVVATAAGYVPAWRATRVNPVRALRYE